MQYADYALWQRELLGRSGEPGSLARAPARLLARDAARPGGAARPADRPPAPGAADVARRPAALRPRARARVRSLRALAPRDRREHVHGASRPPSPRCCTASAPATTSRSARRSPGATTRRSTTLVGFFVNTLVLRCRRLRRARLRRPARRGCATTDLAAYAHADVPFDAVVEALNPPRALGRNPLFQVMVAAAAPIGAGRGRAAARRPADRGAAVRPAGGEVRPRVHVHRRRALRPRRLHARLRAGSLRRRHRALARRAAHAAARAGDRRSGPPAGDVRAAGRRRARAGAAGLQRDRAQDGRRDAAGRVRRPGRPGARRHGADLRGPADELRASSTSAPAGWRGGCGRAASAPRTSSPSRCRDRWS